MTNRAEKQLWFRLEKGAEMTKKVEKGKGTEACQEWQVRLLSGIEDVLVDSFPLGMLQPQREDRSRKFLLVVYEPAESPSPGGRRARPFPSALRERG